MRTQRLLLIFFVAVYAAQLCFAQSGRTNPINNLSPIPAPEAVLGFKPGTDRKLAKWESFVAYFRKLAEVSDRIKVDEIGQTTLKRPFIVATIAASETMQRMDEYKNIQRQLADPRLVKGNADELIAKGKNVITITCSIHSSEPGGTFSCAELAHKLVSDNSAETKAILENTIVTMVPSLNPDGTDIIADWYAKTLGTPSEGTTPPELYHYYTGHDNNRDWYAFTQIETQLTVDKLLNVWHPQILHDIHQMGGNAARFFVPPYTEPWEPNIDPAITAGVNALGSQMANELTAQGKRGVVINGVYDAWTPARAYTHYHAGLRILSETASARLATPVNVLPTALRAGIGYDARERSWNFPAPWLGGRWTLRDIIDYQTAGAWALLKTAAAQREAYVRNFYEIGKRAVAAQGMPYAIILPEPALPASLQDAVTRMKAGMSKAQQSTGTDKEKHEKEDAAIGAISNEPASSAEVNYFYKTEGLDRVLAILKRGGVEVRRSSAAFQAEGKSYPAGTHFILMTQPYAAFAKTLLEAQRYPDLRDGGVPRRPYDVTAHTLPLLMNVQANFVTVPFTVESRPEPMSIVIQGRTRANSPTRLGLYKSYSAAMDEGWTRWVFDQYKFPYKSVTDGEIKQGNLREKFDAILLPEQSAAQIKNGLPAASYPAEFAGGLGEAGVQALRAFVEAGGTLIALNDATEFAVEELKLPVRNVLDGVSNRDFYCPGSILRTQVAADHPLAFGVEKESIAWFELSPAFEITDATKAKAVVTYPADASSLLSGWILGEQRLRGKAALVEVTVGQGRVILFGFRPQYRGQSLATLPLLFNAILTSKN